MSDDEMERRLRDNERAHDLSHWHARRVDRDLAEIGAMQTDHTRRLERIEAKLREHTARFDSLDAQLASLTMMVGDVLNRLPAPENGD